MLLLPLLLACHTSSGAVDSTPEGADTDTGQPSDTTHTAGDTEESGGESADTGDSVASDDRDGDRWGVGDDCEDSDATIHPGAPEVCDGLDQDCDGGVDEACVAAPVGSYTSVDAQALILGPYEEGNWGLHIGILDLDGDGVTDVVSPVSHSEQRRVYLATGAFPPEEVLDEEADLLVEVGVRYRIDGSETRGVDLSGGGTPAGLFADATRLSETFDYAYLLFLSPRLGSTADDADLMVWMEPPGVDSFEWPASFQGAALPGEGGTLVFTGSWYVSHDGCRAETWLTSAEETGEQSTRTLTTLGPMGRLVDRCQTAHPLDAGDLDGDGGSELGLVEGALTDLYLSPLLPGDGERDPDVRLAGVGIYDDNYRAGNFGWGAPGDLDGDGREELILGHEAGDDHRGEFEDSYVVVGVDERGGVGVDVESPILVLMDETGTTGLSSLVTLDADGDDVLDLAFAHDTEADSGEGNGCVYLEYGPFVGVREVGGPTAARICGVEERQSFGTSVAAGDTNGDGFDDLAVGSLGGNEEDDPGTVWVFLGGPATK